MAKDKEPTLVEPGQEIDIERFSQRLNMLDQRLDNIDSVVTAVVERVMKQPITFNVTCSNCGQNIEIALIGTEKPRK